MNERLMVWRGWNREPGNLIQGKVDLDRIGLIGHSWGGEKVTFGTDYASLLLRVFVIDGRTETSLQPTP